MIDALQQVISQMEQLPPEIQAKLAEEVQTLLLEHQRQRAEQARVAQMSADEFANFLAERRVTKPYLAPGYRGIYYSDEEFDEALRRWSGPEALELYEQQKHASDANV
jgi:arginyl-tRNA--protein-N-Asp/Glu arginylyltransferase